MNDPHENDTTRSGRHARFGDDYLDPRSPEQRLADRRGVRRQAASLGYPQSEDAFRRELTVEVQRRRTDRSDLVQFDLTEDGQGKQVALTQGELLVRPNHAEERGLTNTLSRYGLTSSAVGELDGRLLRMSNSELPSSRLPDMATLLRRSGHQVSVNYVIPLGPVMKGMGGPEPTQGSRQYPIDLPRTATTPAPVQVAVIDTGITAEQRKDGWLQDVPRDGNVDPLDALPHSNGFLDFAAGHGTFASGVVAQVSPGTRLAVYRAIDSDGIGSELDVATAMVRAAADGASVISLSLGTETIGDQPLVAIEVALDVLEEHYPDVLVVAAAGNEGSTRPVWPAASKRVVAVAALTADLTPAQWSSSGFWVDCSTVGEGVLSTFVAGEESVDLDPEPDTWGNNAWAVWSGTSFAAPQVAAAVARIASETPCRPREALRLLLEDAPHIPDFGRAVRILPGT